MLGMMLWISDVSGYPIPELPSVVYLSDEDLKSHAYGCDDIPVLKENKDICNSKEFWDLDEGKGNPIALYDHIDKVIILNKKFNIKTIRDKSVVFHELVHHMQYESGQNFKTKCKGDIEKEAYELQDKWLQEKYGVNVWDTIGINKLFLHMITNCKVYLWGT
jgi:hypothetical protein